MYYYDFNMVGLLLRVASPFPLANLFELEHYKIEYCPDEQPEALYSIKMLPEDWTPRGKLIREERQTAVYEWHGEHHRYYFWSIYTKARYVLLAYKLDDLRNYTIYLQQDGLPELLRQFRLSAFFALERLLLHHGAFQLHSSVIAWRGMGILFSAPSGTGKSTQAELWRTLEGAQIINGDRAMIRQRQGEYEAYGSPYAGTSGIYTNLRVAVRAIVVLSQAPENRLERLEPSVAFGKLYREATVPSWDADFVEKISELIIDLIGQVPVYHLACRPDAGAVEVLKQELTKE